MTRNVPVKLRRNGGTSAAIACLIEVAGIAISIALSTSPLCISGDTNEKSLKCTTLNFHSWEQCLVYMTFRLNWTVLYYIALHQSNTKWKYYNVAHKDTVFPWATDPEKKTKKLHLGKPSNPNYLRAVVELERTRSAKAKSEALNAVAQHLLALKCLWRQLRNVRRLDTTFIPGKEFYKEMGAFKDESIIDFIRRQSLNQP